MNVSKTTKAPAHPVEGCTRCWCGSKYWDGDRCHSCGEAYRPRNYDANGEL